MYITSFNYEFELFNSKNFKIPSSSKIKSHSCLNAWHAGEKRIAQRQRVGGVNICLSPSTFCLCFATGGRRWQPLFCFRTWKKTLIIFPLWFFENLYIQSPKAWYWFLYHANKTLGSKNPICFHFAWFFFHFFFPVSHWSWSSRLLVYPMCNLKSHRTRAHSY